MARRRWDWWLVPIFMGISGFAIYLILDNLPPSVFGTEWATIKIELLLFIPWLTVLAIAVYILNQLLGRRH